MEEKEERRGDVEKCPVSSLSLAALSIGSSSGGRSAGCFSGPRRLSTSCRAEQLSQVQALAVPWTKRHFLGSPNLSPTISLFTPVAFSRDERTPNYQINDEGSPLGRPATSQCAAWVRRRGSREGQVYVSSAASGMFLCASL